LGCRLEVLATVELNGKATLGAIEVQDVGTYRVLTAKLEAFKLASTKALPDEDFGVSRFET
jgi:hypothetical protein